MAPVLEQWTRSCRDLVSQCTAPAQHVVFSIEDITNGDGQFLLDHHNTKGNNNHNSPINSSKNHFWLVRLALWNVPVSSVTCLNRDMKWIYCWSWLKCSDCSGEEGEKIDRMRTRGAVLLSFFCPSIYKHQFFSLLLLFLLKSGFHGFPWQSEMIESVDLLSFRVSGRSKPASSRSTHWPFGFCYKPYSELGLYR